MTSKLMCLYMAHKILKNDSHNADNKGDVLDLLSIFIYVYVIPGGANYANYCKNPSC